MPYLMFTYVEDNALEVTGWFLNPTTQVFIRQLAELKMECAEATMAQSLSDDKEIRTALELKGNYKTLVFIENLLAAMKKKAEGKDEEEEEEEDDGSVR